MLLGGRQGGMELIEQASGCKQRDEVGILVDTSGHSSHIAGMLSSHGLQVPNPDQTFIGIELPICWELLC